MRLAAGDILAVSRSLTEAEWLTNGAVVVDPADASPETPLATIHSTTADFLAWSTTRLPWRSHVDVASAKTVAARFLDTVNLT
jgi:hypothetical protein